MQLDNSKVFKVEVLTVAEFASAMSGISPTAIYSAIKAGAIDYVSIGKHKLIVMTKLTRQYKPNDSPKRIKPKKKLSKKAAKVTTESLKPCKNQSGKEVAACELSSRVKAMTSNYPRSKKQYLR